MTTKTAPADALAPFQSGASMCIVMLELALDDIIVTAVNAHNSTFMASLLDWSYQYNDENICFPNVTVTRIIMLI